MTAATGAKCLGGVFLYADRNIIASDGGVTQSSKIYYRNLVEGSIALASATDDAISARDVADQILNNVVVADCRTIREVISSVRDTLINWSQPYASDELKAQFLMAVGIAGGSYLYVLQPRNTVTPIDHVHSIGGGSRVIEQLIPSLFCGGLMFEPKAALFMLAYMTKHAKMKEALVGNQSGSDALFVRPKGVAIPISGRELFIAEEIIFRPDAVIEAVRRFFLAFAPPEAIKRDMEELYNMIASQGYDLQAIVEFKSLNDAVLTT